MNIDRRIFRIIVPAVLAGCAAVVWMTDGESRAVRPANPPPERAVAAPTRPAPPAARAAPSPESPPPAIAAPVPAPAPAPHKPPRAWSGTEHFSPETEKLVRHIEQGRPVALRIGVETRQVAFAPADTLTDNFQISTGVKYDTDWMPSSVRVFHGLGGSDRIPVTVVPAHRPSEEGAPENPDTPCACKGCASGKPHGVVAEGSGRAEAMFTLAVVNGGFAFSVVEPDGAYTTVRRDPVSGEYSALTIEPHEANLHCGDGGRVDGKPAQALKSGWAPTEATWAERGVPVSIDLPGEPEVQAVDATGSNDPSTGVNSRGLEQTPLGPVYEGQLKPAPEIWGVARDYVANDTPEYLEQQAAYYLAMHALVAGNYEYQLGTRRMLMELMLFPNVEASTATWGTGPTGGARLDQWRSLLDTWRPQWQFQWSTAQGFTELWGGLAWVGTWHGGWSAGINSNWHWVIVAHETGHNAGTGHTNGGVMNPYVGDSHDFFTYLQNSTTTTAANQIYNHINARGFKTGILRNPNEMPFAVHDNVTTPVDTPKTFDPRSNDLLRTPGTGTADNEIMIVELSAISPSGAGTATFTPTSVTFTPAAGYEGLAWFSYTLRGTVGNNGDGWLHRATIAMTVGSDTRSRTAITIPAGKAVEMRVPSGGQHILTQPAQAIAAYHQLYYTGAHRKYVIYARPDATGTDSFTYSTGGTPGTINITYTAPETLTAVEDVVMYDQDSGAVRFNPLGNDRGQGSRGFAQDPGATVVMTDAVTPLADQDYLDDTFRLVSATLVDAGKGTLAVETTTWSRDSVATPAPSGYLTFTPAVGATGVAHIEYTVADNLGNTATGDAYVVLPLGTIKRPYELGGTVNALKDDMGLVLEAENPPSPAEYPIHGAPISNQWSAWKLGGITNTFHDAAQAVARVTFDRTGDTTLQLQSTANGFTTTRRALVKVVSASQLPVAQNLGPYLTFTPAMYTTTASSYNFSALGLAAVHDGKPTGSSIAYGWTQLDGPASAVISNANTLDASATLPVPGAYTFSLVLDDGQIKTFRNFGVWRYEDTDHDGLPDDWETEVFGDLSRDGSHVAAGSPHTAMQEFVAGSNAATSQHLKFTQAVFDGGGGLTLSWDSAQTGPGPARTFSVFEKGGNFSNSTAWAPARRGLYAAGATTSHYVPYAATAPSLRYFRVGADGPSSVTASPDIIGVQRHTLLVGRNFISSPFLHDSATVGSVLGTMHGLPAGATESAATVVDFWNESTQSMSQRVWLSSAAGFTGWRQTGTFNDAANQAVDLSRGMAITLRSSAGTRVCHLVGRVPTAATQTTSVAANGYTLTAINYPAGVLLGSLGLPAAGFTGGGSYLSSDLLMIHNNSTGTFDQKYWYDSAHQVWRSASASSPIVNPTLLPGAPLLIQRRNRAAAMNIQFNRPYTTPFTGP